MILAAPRAAARRAWTIALLALACAPAVAAPGSSQDGSADPGASEQGATEQGAAREGAPSDQNLQEGAPAAGTTSLEDLPDYGSELLRMLLSLGVVLGLLVIAAWLVPRWLTKHRPPAPGRHLELVETMRLDARRVLYLVRVDGELVLIGGGEGGLVRLSGDAAAHALGETAFAERLRAVPHDTAK